MGGVGGGGVERTPSGSAIELTKVQAKASRDGSFKDLLARGRILFLKLNNFSTNRHINSLPTLPFSPQESKPGK